MNDDATFTALRDRLTGVCESLGDVHMTTPATAIFRRSRKRRARRVTAAGAGTAALGVTLGLALAPASEPPPVHVHLAAWSVDTNPDGTVSFRLNSTSHPARLQHVLAEAGVPAMVRWGEVCLARGRHVLLLTSGIVRVSGASFSVAGRAVQPGSVFLMIRSGRPVTPLNWSWTITPARIPPGARFVISALPSGRAAPGSIQAAWEFVPGGAPVTCATSVTPSAG